MNRIRELRQARGWSLQRLADEAATSKGQVDKLEKGARRLTVDWMVRLAKPLRCDPRDLMSGAPAHAFAPARLIKTKSADPGFIPVRGLISRGARGKGRDMVFAKGAVDYIPCPHYLLRVKDSYALYVADDSMAPMYRPRQLLFINPYKSPSPGGGVVLIGKKGSVRVREFVGMAPNGVIVREYKPQRRESLLANKECAGMHAVAGAIRAFVTLA